MKNLSGRKLYLMKRTPTNLLLHANGVLTRTLTLKKENAIFASARTILHKTAVLKAKTNINPVGSLVIKLKIVGTKPIILKRLS